MLLSGLIHYVTHLASAYSVRLFLQVKLKNGIAKNIATGSIQEHCRVSHNELLPE